MEGETLVTSLPVLEEPSPAENAENAAGSAEELSAEIEKQLVDEAKEKKLEQGRAKVMEEILQTEGVYLQDLKKIQQLCMEPLLKEPEIMPRDEIHVIFSNLPTIIELHEYLYDQMQRAFDEPEKAAGRLSATFLAACDFLKNYSIYCANRPHSINAQDRLRKKYPRLEKILSDAEKVLAFPLDAFLVKPVQRLCRYPLLFSALLHKTPETHPEHANLQKTLARLQHVTNDVNEFSRKSDSVNKIFELGLHLGGFDEPLNVPGRLLLLELPCIDVIHPMVGEKREPFYIVIFTDMIIFAKQKPKKKLAFKHKLSLAHSSVREPALVGGSEWPLVLIESAGKSVFEITLFIGTKYEKDTVLKTLSAQIKVEREKAALSPPTPSISPPKSHGFSASTLRLSGGGMKRSSSGTSTSNSVLSSSSDEISNNVFVGDSLSNMGRRRSSIGDFQELAEPHVSFGLATVNEDGAAGAAGSHNRPHSPHRTGKDLAVSGASLRVQRRKSLPADFSAAGFVQEMTAASLAGLEESEGAIAATLKDDTISAETSSSSKGNIFKRILQRSTSKKSFSKSISSLDETSSADDRLKNSTSTTRTSSESSVSLPTDSDVSDTERERQSVDATNETDEVRRLKREIRKLKERLAESQKTVATLVDALRGIEKAAAAVASRASIL